jgi:ATP-dependent Lon protease
LRKASRKNAAPAETTRARAQVSRLPTPARRRRSGEGRAVPAETREQGETGEKRASRAPPARRLQSEELVLLPVRNLLLFPGVVLPVTIGREKSVRALQEVVRTQKPIGILLQRDPENDEPGPGDLHDVGTAAAVLRYVDAGQGGHHAVCQGLHRFRVLEFKSTEPWLVARVARIPEPEHDGREVEALSVNVRQLGREAIELMPGAPAELAGVLDGVQSPSQLANMMATFIDLPAGEKQQILETVDLRGRLELIVQRLAHLVQVLRLSSHIRQQTKGSLDKAQRESYLREQLRTIQRELGEGDEGANDLRELSEAVEKTKLPAEAEKEVQRELKRLEHLSPAAAEYAMVRTWLELVTDLPWSRSTEDQLDIARAKRILDEDHHGLQKVKRRILEFLAVRKLKPDSQGPILCLVGPPGVGKTSLGLSIARAMGRNFAHVSLGGVHDEAEIRGHRRTYIGAMPGRILQGLRRAGSNNPVFMLDELDKLSASFHGDPSAALLEVLDPAQNRRFRDNYLDLPFDLSRVLFVATANVLDQIPGPLLDRCEVIRLTGYIEDEKLAIAQRYLVPRQLESNGLGADQFQVGEDAIREVIRRYTREAGVRHLERELGALARNAASRIAAEEVQSVRIEPADLQAILGPQKFENEVKLRTAVPGVATGLAWTPTGGEILFVEATRMPGKGRLILTGQLGEVMRESAQAALSLIKSLAGELGLDVERFDELDLHIHLPAGAIPKDGPSAGVAIYVALVSLLQNRTVRSDVAMSGEISLRGLVLPVGGLREKVLAALAAGIRTVLLPARNRKDVEEIPEHIRTQLNLVWIETVQDAVAAALGEPAPAEPAPVQPAPAA